MLKNEPEVFYKEIEVEVEEETETVDKKGKKTVKKVKVKKTEKKPILNGEGWPIKEKASRSRF